MGIIAPPIGSPATTGQWNVLNSPFNAKGDGVTDDTAAFESALATAAIAGGDVLVPAPRLFKITKTLKLPENVRLLGLAGQQPIFLNERGSAALTYTGTGPCLEAANTAGKALFSVAVENITINGKNAIAGATGIFINGTAGSGTEGFGVIGVKITNCMIQNFTGNQVKGDGLILGLHFRECSFENSTVGEATSLHLCQFNQTGGAGKIMTQLTFEECFFNNAGKAGEWCIIGNDAGDLRMIGGTVACGLAKALSATGTNGVSWKGGLFIYGTHFEGASNEQANVAIRVAGVNGGFICPSCCKTWGTGVQVGDPTAAAQTTVGVTVAGSIEANAANKDIVIVKGGLRPGTVIMTNNTPQVTDERIAEGASETSNRLLVGAPLEAMTERAANAEVLPPAVAGQFKAKKVNITIVTKAEKTKLEIKVGGVTVTKWEGIAGLGVEELSFAVDVAAGKTWEVKVTEGAVTKVFSTYTPINP